MKCNIRELAVLSDQPCTIEGRLNYRKMSTTGYRNQSGFKVKWFRLIKNYLFYFKISEFGKFDTKNPAGVFLMENSSIQMEHGQTLPFSFSISFIDDPDKRHIFAARAEDNVVQWVIKLRECSYEYMRNRLHILQSKIFSLTGKDPLLLVPRNEGARLWAPSVPFSTAGACTVNTNSFSCHLHTNGAFTLERSKSDLQALQKYHESHTNSRFYTKTTTTQSNDKIISEPSNYALERSKTSALFSNLNLGDESKSPGPVRAAPSPPVRTKRTELTNELMIFSEKGNHLNTGILSDTPVPPKRKISPKPIQFKDASEELFLTDKEDDLIKF